MYLKHSVDFSLPSTTGAPQDTAAILRRREMTSSARGTLSPRATNAHSALGIPYERVVVLEHSNDATIAMGAGSIQPDHMGILVLASLPGLPQGWQKYGSAEHKRPHTILALHGEKDRHLAVPFARALIEKVFGEDVLVPLPQNWQVLTDEDHVLHLDSSWAVVRATILRELGFLSCEKPQPVGD